MSAEEGSDADIASGRFWAAILAAILAVTLITVSGSASTGSVVFLSGQASELTEAQGLRSRRS